MPHDAFLATLRDAAERVSSHLWSTITQPMLVMPAERDGFTPLHTSAALRDGLQCVEYSVIPEGTHVAPVEFPEVILKRFHRFAADHKLDQSAPLAPRARPTLAQSFMRSSRSVAAAS